MLPFEIFSGKTEFSLAALGGVGAAGKKENVAPWALPTSVATVQPALLLSFSSD